MENIDFYKLKEGDIVMNKFSGLAYVIVHNDGNGGFLAVRAITITNSSEWDFVYHLEKNEDKKDIR